MADQRTMAELLRAPTEGYAKAIVVPSILAEQFELKYSLINLLRACPHHGFTELHQLDTFYNALNPADQDSLNSVAGGNVLERRTQDVLTIIKNKSKVRNSQNKSIVSQVKSSDANYSTSEIDKLTHAVNQQTSDVTTAMTAILKQFQATLPPASIKAVEEICVTCGGAHPYYQCLAAGGNTFLKLRDNIQGYVFSSRSSGHLHINTIANPKGELKSITTRSGIVLDRPSVPIPPSFINPEEDGRVDETLTDQDLAEYTIKVPPPLQEKDEVQIHKFWQMFKQLHINITLADALILIPKYQKMLKALLSNKEKLLELANTPFNENCSAVILKKLREKLRDPGKFLIPCGFSELKYKALADLESINMINIFNDSSEDFLEDLFATNHQSGNLTFSSHPNLTSPKVKDDIFDPEGGNVLIEKFLYLDSTEDLHPPHNINPLSGSATSSSPNPLLEFADELALITFPPGNDDLPFDIDKLTDLNDNLADTMPKMFIDEHALDYSSPPLYDEYDDDLFEVESDTEYVYDDPFDFKEEKIKESKLLIDELNLPSDFLPSSEYDSFLFKDFFKVDALPSTNNEDKVFNPGILIRENLFEVITRVAPDKNVKKLAISHASLILEDFAPHLYELLFFKEVTGAETLLSFSFENEKKVFKPEILTSKGVHSFLIPKLYHQGYKVFKIIKIL
nr:hypothetical protein [Tanacetum cinerariifolium]